MPQVETPLETSRPPEQVLRVEYAAALDAYLQDASEETLFRAASLGRRALAADLGVLDLVLMHNSCFAEILGRSKDRVARHELEANTVFLAEALSPYEMTHRGFQEVNESIQRMVHFTAVVCHELRTPLTSVVNSLGMLVEVLNAAPGTAASRLLSNIRMGTEILNARTNDLLDLAGFQSGTLSLRPQRTDAARVVDTVVQAMTPEASRAGVLIELEAAPQLPIILADPDRLRQVVMNLVQNALKYGADGKKIDVRTGVDGSDLVIEVQDYGQGVSLWDRMRIFEPNYRGSNRAHDIPGLGIGLALCSALIQQHKGSITLESEEGAGSLFRVRLPLRTQGPRGEPHEGAGDRGRGRSR